MRRKHLILPYFLLFLCASLVIYLFSKTYGLGIIDMVLQKAVRPFGMVYTLFTKSYLRDEKYEKLRQENAVLQKKLLDQTELLKENRALKDQFLNTTFSTTKLLPARIIGSSTFLPSVSTPESFIIDKGLQNGIKMGMGVIFENNVVGRVVKTSSYRSEIELIISKKTSFAVWDRETSALGIIKGKGGNELVLNNVLLSENINPNDIVVTKGDLNLEGIGYPEGLIVGKILSIDKKPSNLFQSAKVMSMLDFTRLTDVFVIFP